MGKRLPLLGGDIRLCGGGRRSQVCPLFCRFGGVESAFCKKAITLGGKTGLWQTIYPLSIMQIPVWLTFPFVLLLILVATGPVFFPKQWHKMYPWLVPALGLGVIGYQLVHAEYAGPVSSVMDYVGFISCVLGLYMASSGIWLDLHLPQATPAINSAILVGGGLLSNLIGTTGASVLLLRPFIRLNQGRLRPFHVVFFIFMVSNVGGSLFFFGDAPLFLGYLQGVPATWTLRHLSAPWVVSMSLLTLIFYWLDSKEPLLPKKEQLADRAAVELRGKRSFFWLGLMLVTLLLDPGIFSWVPMLQLAGKNFSYLRELCFVLIAAGAYLTADKEVLRQNRFSMAPMLEVMIIFFGIFTTMHPAMELLREKVADPAVSGWLTPAWLFWETGIASAVLDNAPTYVAFLKAGMGAAHIDTVATYAATEVPRLLATSLGAVFFGAMTYIGNGPNFMVKSVAEEQGVEMPSFFGYVVSYALPFLLPVLAVVWALFVGWGA